MDELVESTPVECQVGELAGVWSGWRILGDREVVREASAKGIHIKLAYKCLAYRMHCTIAEAQEYFNNEVCLWVDELLNKRQVFRATHVLNNTGKNAAEYILSTCIKCEDGELRDHLAEHLINSGNFDDASTEAWNFLKFIAEHEKRHSLELGSTSEKSINDVLHLSDNVKEAVYNELYLDTFNMDKEKYLKNNVMWDNLLLSNNVELLNLWISINFGKKSNESLTKVLSNMEITQDMIEAIETSQAMIPAKQLLLNHLCKYGIFTKKEETSLKSILRRLFGSSISSNEFEIILLHSALTADKTMFLSNLNSILLLPDYMEEKHLQTIGLKNVHFITMLKKMCDAESDFVAELQRGLVQTSRYLSSDITQFSRENHLLLLALITLQLTGGESNGKTLKSILFEDCNLEIFDCSLSNTVIREALFKIPYLRQILLQLDNKDGRSLTMYDLIDGFKNFHVQQAFKWRFENDKMLHFSNDELTMKYGHRENITYLHYLKEARPFMAIHVLGQIEKSPYSFSKSKSPYSFCANALAMVNLSNVEVLCGCVAFLEMLNVSSDLVRLHITAAEYVQKECNISLAPLLEKTSSKTPKNLRIIMSYLENSFSKHLNVDLLEDVQVFMRELKMWDVIVRFANAHSTAKPVVLLKFLAKRNKWLEFIVILHLYGYPIEQTIGCLMEFTNAHVKEHLLRALNNKELCQTLISSQEQESKLNVITEKTLKQPTINQYLDVESLDGPDASDISDLWLVIFKSHQSQDPPGALIKTSYLKNSPVLTVLATCYEPSSIAYCYSWMVISMKNKVLFEEHSSLLEHQIWPSIKVLQLFETILTLGHVRTLSRGFSIFMPENPLCSLFQFLLQFVHYGNFEECELQMSEFKSRCSGLKCNKMIDWEYTDTTYLKNLFWIETAAVRCIICFLGCCLKTRQQKIKFLQILIKTGFEDGLTVNSPKFFYCIEFIKILAPTKVRVNFVAFNASISECSYEVEIQRCINELVQNGLYQTALTLSKVAKMDPSNIIFSQYRHEFSQRTSEALWKKCMVDFTKHEVTVNKAIEFCIEHAEKETSHKERYEILKLALEMARESTLDRCSIDTVEMAMWKSYILAEHNDITCENPNMPFRKLSSELLLDLRRIHVKCTLDNEFEMKSFELLINQLLDADRLHTALRLSTIFNYQHRDLQVLMLCLTLAEGKTTPEQLTSQEKELLSEGSISFENRFGVKKKGVPRSALTSPSTGSSAANPFTSSNFTERDLDCLAMLEKLVKSLQFGGKLGHRVLLCYKLSFHLNRNYQTLLLFNDPLLLLQEIFDSDRDDKYEICFDIINAYSIDNNEAAKFFARKVVDQMVHAAGDTSFGWLTDNNFGSILALCNDPSLLGNQLLNSATKLMGQSQGEKRDVATLKVIIELLIRSHCCFTSSCNMEGIAAILRKCQSLTNTLQTLKHWNLLVRLITGVGRFTEMNYIFQILKEHDQFEYLLRGGLMNTSGLKVAILEFLKRSCPKDTELFTIVALHFRMYNEIASMWHTEAKLIVSKLVDEARKEFGLPISFSATEIKFVKNEQTEKVLNVAMTNFTHATQYYLQASKMNLASKCSFQAQLVALQLSLLNATVNGQKISSVFNLTGDDIDLSLATQLTFPQGIILTRIYNYDANWANPLYNHYIVKGENKYLDDMIAARGLTSSIIRDCARRYQTEKAIPVTKSMTENMKNLVKQLCDTECQYVLASQLGFKSLIENMLANVSISSYLKDSAWNVGYNFLEYMEQEKSKGFI